MRSCSRALLFATLLPASLLWACGGEPDLGAFERVVVQRDLLKELAAWQVVAGPDGGEASIGVLTPSYSSKLDAGDHPSLLLPPGAVASIRIPAGDPPAVLRCAAGVDLSVPRSLDLDWPPLRVRFTARLDDELVFERVVPVHPTEDTPATARVPQVWHWLGGKRKGLHVRGGQTLTLKVELRGDRPAGLAAPRLGFGGLVTERSLPTSRRPASPDSPNILLVVVDTERADRTSTDGYAKPTTPHLDRLAERGLVFEDAWVPAPWTWPSTASILTGLEPLGRETRGHEVGGHGVVAHDACHLDHGLTSLPEALQEQGFTTGGFSCNPLIVADKGFDAGFEHFETTEDFTPGVEVMPRVLEWLRENAGHRFFLYLHLVDPHDPHRPLPAELARLGGSEPAGFANLGYRKLGGRLRKNLIERGPAFVSGDFVTPVEEQWVSDVYDACVATADAHLGRLLDELEGLGIDDRTVVAYTSDHGEELFEHGLTNHAHSLHPELMRVPLVLAGPGVPRGERRAERVSNRHLATTLALRAGAELPVADGLDLLAAGLEAESTLYFHTTKGIWNDQAMVEIFGLLEDDWALHWAPRGLPFRAERGTDTVEGQWRLYDRRRDPGELVDVAAAHPDVAARLLAELEARVATGRGGRTTLGAGAATRHLLEGIGYVELEEE